MMPLMQFLPQHIVPTTLSRPKTYAPSWIDTSSHASSQRFAKMLRRAGLYQGVVRAREHRLRLFQGINFARTRLFAKFKVLDQPITFEVEVLDVLHGRHRLCRLRLFLLAHRLECRLRLRLGSLLLLDELRVRRTFLCGIRHEFLVILLGILLLGCDGGHLCSKVLNQKIDHRDDPTALLALLRVGAVGLGRRRRRFPLREHGDTSARNATWRRGGGCGAAHAHHDTLLPRQLALRGRLVQLWVVKFVEPVLRQLKELFGGSVGGHGLGVLLVLFLPLLRGLGYVFVKILDALHKRCNLLRESGNGGLPVRNVLLEILKDVLKLLQFVLSNVELGLAVLFLFVVSGLLLPEQHDHFVDHADNLREAHLLPTERKGNEVQPRVLPLVATKGPESLPPDLTHAHPRLQERRARERFLEKFQRIIIVEDLDRLRKRNDLLCPHLRAVLPVLRLRRAVFFQVGKELLVLLEGLYCVLHILLRVHDFHAELSDTRQFGLDCLRRCLYLLRLRRHQLLVQFDGFLFGLGGVRQVRYHRVQHLFHDSDDLSALGCVLCRGALALGKERGQHVAIGAAEVDSQHQPPQHGSGGGLQETVRPLGQRSDGFLQRSHVRLGLSSLLREGCGFFFAHCRRLGHRRLCRLPVLLVLRNLFLERDHLCFHLFDGLQDLWNFGFRIRDGLRQGRTSSLTPTHELFVQFLLGLAFRRDFFLHHL